MGAVRMRVQIADKNITIIHTTPVHQIIPCEKKLQVCKKQIHQDILTLNCSFQHKYKLIIIKFLSLVKKLSHLNQERNMQRLFMWIWMWEVNRSKCLMDYGIALKLNPWRATALHSFLQPWSNTPDPDNQALRIPRHLQVGVSWSWLELNWAVLWPSRNWVWDNRIMDS